MSRSRRVAVDAGGGPVAGFGPATEQDFNSSGYTVVALPTPLDLGMPTPVTSLVVWKEGFVSIGDVTQAQIDFVHDHYTGDNLHTDLLDFFPGDYISTSHQDYSPAQINLQSDDSGSFYITWGDPTQDAGNDYAELAVTTGGFTMDPGLIDHVNPDGDDTYTTANRDYTVGYRLGTETILTARADGNPYDVTDTTHLYTHTGTASAETLTGGMYADIIIGGGGGDTLTGGAGADYFRYTAASDSTTAAPDRITDFQSGSEKIDARALGADGVMLSQAGGLYVVDIATAFGTLHVMSNNPVAIGDILLTDSNAGATLTGTSGSDLLYGFGGNDNLSGGAGADTMTGGTGNDIYHVDNVGDRVFEAPGEGTDLVYSAIGYTLPDNVENLMLTGTGSINASGNALDNVLTGTAGNNAFDGLAGNDTVSFANDTTAAITASLATGQATGFGTDTLTNIENLTGGTYNDMLTGDGNANILNGGPGDDRLDGGAGSDTASYAGAPAAVTVSLALTGAQATGGAGSDTLVLIENLMGSGYADHLTGSSLANTIEGGLGNDVLDGGGGTDTVTYAHATAAVTVSLALTSAQNSVGAGSDTLTNFENLTGSDYNDILTGNAGDNYLAGGNGDDLLAGGLGNDTLSGSLGLDTASYANAGAAITASLTSNTATGEGSDTLKSIENLIGSAYADHLTGSGIANTIEGGAGDDVLDGVGTGDGDFVSYAHATAAVTVSLALTAAQNTGGAGTDTLSHFEGIIGSNYGDTLTGSSAADTLLGGNGNDTLDGGAGDDVLNGGAGTDVASFVSAASGVTASLADGHAGGASSGSDTLIGFENLTGSNFNDFLFGDAGNNYLAGGNGDDVLVGGLGNDTYSGSLGNDTASFAGSAAAVTVSLATNTATGEGSDTLKSIENIIGSNHADTLTGDANNNVINPGGGLGGDNVDGGGGNDTISFAGQGAVTVNLADASYGSPGFASYGNGPYDVVHLKSIENVIGSAYADTFYGDASDNSFHGAGGGDLIYGNGGSDHFYFDYDPVTSGPIDTVGDFEHGSDTIELSRAVFDAIASVGQLDPSAFESGSEATSDSTRILYDTASGDLFYDPDGSGSAPAIYVALLDGAPSLSASDIHVF